jgi:TfoX/Sxy family transcriptional regulator of competence genes
VAAHEALISRVRAALGSDLPFTEKKMFGGVTFMVRGKMSISVGRERCMFRIDPAIHDAVVGRDGSRTVLMKGREYKGYIHVDAHALKAAPALTYWIDLALAWNRALTGASAKLGKRSPRSG